MVPPYLKHTLGRHSINPKPFSSRLAVSRGSTPEATIRVASSLSPSSEAPSNRSLPSIGDPSSPGAARDFLTSPLPHRRFWRACFLDREGNPLPPSSPPSDYYLQDDIHNGEQESGYEIHSGDEEHPVVQPEPTLKASGGVYEDDDHGVSKDASLRPANKVHEREQKASHVEPKRAKKLADGRKNSKAYYWRNLEERRNKASARKQRLRDALNNLPPADRDRELEAARAKQREYARRSRERKKSQQDVSQVDAAVAPIITPNPSTVRKTRSPAKRFQTTPPKSTSRSPQKAARSLSKTTDKSPILKAYEKKKQLKRERKHQKQLTVLELGHPWWV
ncbi:hypothetical protein AAF712_005640 [Marasmius tenuissimus]|uniref:Uncharacterized protein n=1 Tax=Marasmius tenuissimus TaxID=585030 RepID=A0ABR3A222_9AGAR